ALRPVVTDQECLVHRVGVHRPLERPQHVQLATQEPGVVILGTQYRGIRWWSLPINSFGGQVINATVLVSIQPAMVNTESRGSVPNAYAIECFVPANCHS